MPNSWEIWWAVVKYDDSDERKIRPVVVLENKAAFIISLKVTSHKPRDSFNGEYDLMRWSDAGLTRPSTVRLQAPLKLVLSDFKSKIGDVDAIDIYAIQQLIEFYKQR